MANLDFEIFAGKTFRDLCKDVVDRSESKKTQMDTLISDIRGLIKNPNDAQVFLPRIKELLDVGVKNDEQIVKLVAVVQRLQSTQLETSGGQIGGLTEEEKEQLVQAAAAQQIKDIQKDVTALSLPVSSSLSS